MRLIAAAALAASLAASLASCSDSSGTSAVVWTDVPELAIAVELFNALPVSLGNGRASEGASTVELLWKLDLAEALRSAKAPPALAIGRYLGSSSVGDRFETLDYLLNRNLVRKGAFYPELLETGKIKGRRILLPISFNLPMIVVARGASSVGDGFTLSLAEMYGSSTAFNRKEGGAYTRMGFSPRWDGRFLISSLEAGGALFAEGKELESKGPGLESALGEIIDWVSRANGSAALEDDFKFRYLFAPPYRYLVEGRALYAGMDSSDFFLAPEKRRAALDFRWYARKGSVFLPDGIVSAGLVRGAPGRKTAEAFLSWLLGSEAQRAILERSRRVHALDYSFGIAGGFSSLRAVNEEIFPAFFPALVGHVPPASKLVASTAALAALPADWSALETAVLAPWAQEATAARLDGLSEMMRALPERIKDFRKRGSHQ
jgi:hypothetical protein